MRNNVDDELAILHSAKMTSPSFFTTPNLAYLIELKWKHWLHREKIQDIEMTGS